MSCPASWLAPSRQVAEPLLPFPPMIAAAYVSLARMTPGYFATACEEAYCRGIGYMKGCIGMSNCETVLEPREEANCPDTP